MEQTDCAKVYTTTTGYTHIHAVLHIMKSCIRLSEEQLGYE